MICSVDHGTDFDACLQSSGHDSTPMCAIMDTRVAAIDGFLQIYHTCGEIAPRSVSPPKFHSKFGVVRVRSSGTPRSGVAWLDDGSGMGYIDVANAIYSFVLECIWPGLPFVNPETRGDLVEAILDWSFLTQTRGASREQTCPLSSY